MTGPNQYASPNNGYDLRLPPLAPALSGDEESVWRLADSDVRTGLGRVNDDISARLEEMRDGGDEVREVLRGVAGGRGIAVARRADSGSPEAEALRAAPETEVVTRDGSYVVFLYHLGDLTSEGAPGADEPCTTVSVSQSRSRATIGVPTDAETKPMEIDFPLDGPPTLAGNEIVSFREAAAGRRRVEAATSSVQWVRDAMVRGLEAARKFQNDGDQEASAALRVRVNQMPAYRNVLLDRVYDHPEWVDTAPINDAEVLARFQVYVEQRPEILPYPEKDPRDVASSLLGWAKRGISDNHVLDPAEVEAVFATLRPKSPRVDRPSGDEFPYEEYTNSFYRRGLSLEGKAHAIHLGLSVHRQAAFEAYLSGQ